MLSEERITIGAPALRPRRGAGGRPAREDAVRRDERFSRFATTIVYERGFEGTSSTCCGGAG